MIFTIRMRDFLKLHKRMIVDTTDGKVAILSFFEDETFVHLYLPDEYVVYHTVFKKEEIIIDAEGNEIDEISFRMSFLRGALELVEPPQEKQVRLLVEQ